MKKIGELLREMGVVTDEDIREALTIQEEDGGLLGEILSQRLGYVTEEDLMFALGAQAEMEVVDLDALDIPDDVIEMVPANYAETFQVIPVGFDGDVLVLALADPMNVNVLDDLQFMLGCEVKGAVSSPEAVERALETYYGGETGESMGQLLDEFDELQGTVVEVDQEDDDAYDLEKLEKQAHLPAVVKLLNLILLTAIKDQASDIHLEPFENDFKVRYRIDGVLYEMQAPPSHLAAALASRVKVMADLDISERRMPQDGRIELNIGGRPVDLRVSTLPVMFGESIVMRILDRSNVNLDLEALGMRPRDYDVVTELVAKPNGIILVTGPTGSGKTTTLYSCLRYANDPEVKIITTEDPVEYDLPGVIQVQIDPESGLTYNSSLRAILRQDPDMVLIGEIRDLETAKIAVEASLTGHVVFSTLHTNDAPSVVSRLTDLGVEPFLVAATIEGIVAQRLVRTICEECRTPHRPTEEELAEIDLTPDDLQGKTLYYGKGCRTCNHTGYKGRMGIFEILLGSEAVKELIIEGASTSAIRRQAEKEGMQTLREAGIRAMYDGKTTVEEVKRETVVD